MAILSYTKAKSIKAGSKAVSHGGIRNLLLLPSTRENGVGSWIFRFTDPITGKRAKMTIGHFPVMSIAQAGEEAARLSDAVKRGQDPRYLPKLSASKTVKDVVAGYADLRQSSGAWTSEHTRRAFAVCMRNYILPSLGGVPLDSLQAEMIVKCLLPVRNTKPAMAREVSAKFLSVLSWAYDMGYMEQDIGRKVRRMLGGQSVYSSVRQGHQPAMSWQDIPIVVSRLAATQSCAKSQCILFAILNACRISAARLALWEEINLSEGLWQVEAFSVGRKTKVRRVNPLCSQLVMLLEQNLQDKGYIYINRNGGAVCPLSVSRAFKHCVEDIPSDVAGRSPTLHGVRSTFKTWADVHGYNDLLSEIQLWHTVGNKVYQAYARDLRLEERRPMMQAWADYCFSQAA